MATPTPYSLGATNDEKSQHDDEKHDRSRTSTIGNSDSELEKSYQLKSESGTEKGSSVDENGTKEKVHDLARAVTQQSVKNANGEDVNPFVGSADPLLDPASGKFSARAWTKALLSLQSRDPERYPERTAGIAYKNLNAHGFGQPTDYQKTFGNYPLEAVGFFKQLIGRKQQTKIQILRDFDGLVRSGEMLVVLGRPGSGCSTLLKTIAGETAGFFVDDKSYINYQGISAAQMHKDFRGECIYQAEVDVHFPMMTVGDTLRFAARARGMLTYPTSMAAN